MTARAPQPGELWWTDRRGGLAVKTESGWAWPDGEPINPCVVVSPVGDGPVAYSAAVVDKLRAEVSSERALTKSYRAQTEAVLNQCNTLRAERDAAVARATDFEDLDAAIARAEKAEAELAAEREKVRFPGLDDITRVEPWRVLRAAAEVAGRIEGEIPTFNSVTILADRLEREAAEKSKRDQLIDVGVEAAVNAIHPLGKATDTTRKAVAAVVDAVLAEAVTE